MKFINKSFLLKRILASIIFSTLLMIMDSNGLGLQALNLYIVVNNSIIYFIILLLIDMVMHFIGNLFKGVNEKYDL